MSRCPIVIVQMHLPRSYLGLEEWACSGMYANMKRSIAVLLWMSDVVSKSVALTGPVAKNCVQKLVALLFGADRDPHAEKIVDLVEGQPLGLHLVPCGRSGLEPRVHDHAQAERKSEFLHLHRDL